MEGFTLARHKISSDLKQPGTRTATAEPHPVTDEEKLEYAEELAFLQRLPRNQDMCSDEDFCPYVACRHHLYMSVLDNGNVKFNFPELEVWELEETCSLRVASRGSLLSKDVGSLLNISPQAVRLIQRRLVERVEDEFRDARQVLKDSLNAKRGEESMPDHDVIISYEELEVARQRVPANRGYGNFAKGPDRSFAGLRR